MLKHRSRVRNVRHVRQVRHLRHVRHVRYVRLVRPVRQLQNTPTYLEVKLISRLEVVVPWHDDFTWLNLKFKN